MKSRNKTTSRNILSLILALTMMSSMSLLAFARNIGTERDLDIGETRADSTEAAEPETTYTFSETAIAAAKQAATNAKGTDNKAVVQFTNPGTISLKLLQDMEAASGNTNMSIWGNSYFDGTNSVDVRVYINPASATGDIDLSGSTTSARAEKTTKLYEKYSNNNLAVVSLGQQSSYGHNINVAAKVDLSGMDNSNLHFYAYDRASNTTKQINSANQYVDSNNYLCFTTPYGGDIVVSDGALVSK